MFVTKKAKSGSNWKKRSDSKKAMRGRIALQKFREIGLTR
jgi:hypothetical protein